MEISLTKFKSRLKSLQKKRSLSTQDYAHFLTLTEKRINDFFKGISLPTNAELQIIAAKENVNAEWLAGMDISRQSRLSDAQQSFLAQKWEKSVQLKKECEDLAAQCLAQGKHFSEDWLLLNKNIELEDIRSWCDIVDSLTATATFKH